MEFKVTDHLGLSAPRQKGVSSQVSQAIGLAELARFSEAELETIIAAGRARKGELPILTILVQAYSVLFYTFFTLL